MKSMSSCEVEEAPNETPHVLEGSGSAPVDGMGRKRGVMKPSDQQPQ